MNRDRVFERTEGTPGDFVFDEKVAEVFDDMLRRSIPFYAEQQQMVTDIGRRFWQPGTAIYDLGCSTATTLVSLARAIPACTSLVGYDNSEPMLQRARDAVEDAGLGDRVQIRYGDLNADLADLELGGASVITACWTLQFVRPLGRDDVLRSVQRNLAPGGVFIACEKVLTSSNVLNGIYVDEYHDFKRAQGYSENEIARKREALENVLVPYRLDENLRLLKRAGFASVDTFFQWFNFAGFICLKPADGSRREGGPRPSP
jgi:tRNA (cmo5U34)-methyltransferase